MNKKAFTAAVVVSVLSISILFNSVAANPVLPYKQPQVTILSPSSTEEYHTSNIPLDVSVQIFGYTYQSVEWLNWLKYSLDGQPNVSILLNYPSDYTPGYIVNGSAVLAGLADGAHTLTLYGQTTIGANNENFSSNSIFSVETSPTPEPTIEPTLTPTPTSEPNQNQDFTLPIVLAVAAVIAVAVTILVYFRRRKV